MTLTGPKLLGRIQKLAKKSDALQTVMAENEAAGFRTSTVAMTAAIMATAATMKTAHDFALTSIPPAAPAPALAPTSTDVSGPSLALSLQSTDRGSAHLPIESTTFSTKSRTKSKTRAAKSIQDEEGQVPLPCHLLAAEGVATAFDDESEEGSDTNDAVDDVEEGGEGDGQGGGRGGGGGQMRAAKKSISKCVGTEDIPEITSSNLSYTQLLNASSLRRLHATALMKDFSFVAMGDVLRPLSLSTGRLDDAKLSTAFPSHQFPAPSLQAQKSQLTASTSSGQSPERGSHAPSGPSRSRQAHRAGGSDDTRLLRGDMFISSRTQALSTSALTIVDEAEHRRLGIALAKQRDPTLLDKAVTAYISPACIDAISQTEWSERTTGEDSKYVIPTTSKHRNPPPILSGRAQIVKLDVGDEYSLDLRLQDDNPSPETVAALKIFRPVIFLILKMPYICFCI